MIAITFNRYWIVINLSKLNFQYIFVYRSIDSSSTPGWTSLSRLSTLINDEDTNCFSLRGIIEIALLLPVRSVITVEACWSLITALQVTTSVCGSAVFLLSWSYDLSTHTVKTASMLAFQSLLGLRCEFLRVSTVRIAIIYAHKIAIDKLKIKLYRSYPLSSRDLTIDLRNCL